MLVPGEQAVHLVWPVVLWKKLTGQGVQSTAPPLAEKVPAGQFCGVLVAGVGHCLPAGQAAQVWERAELAKVPGLQGLQTLEPAGAKKPALHDVQVAAWLLEKVPAGQVLHDWEPRALAYWPGAQGSHVAWPSWSWKVPRGLQSRGETGGTAGVSGSTHQLG